MSTSSSTSSLFGTDYRTEEWFAEDTYERIAAYGDVMDTPPTAKMSGPSGTGDLFFRFPGGSEPDETSGQADFSMNSDTFTHLIRFLGSSEKLAFALGMSSPSSPFPAYEVGRSILFEMAGKRDNLWEIYQRNKYLEFDEHPWISKIITERDLHFLLQCIDESVGLSSITKMSFENCHQITGSSLTKFKSFGGGGDLRHLNFRIYGPLEAFETTPGHDSPISSLRPKPISLNIDSIINFLTHLYNKGNDLTWSYLQFPLTWTMLLPDNSQRSELVRNNFDFTALDGQIVLPRLVEYAPSKGDMIRLIESITPGFQASQRLHQFGVPCQPPRGESHQWPFRHQEWGKCRECRRWDDGWGKTPKPFPVRQLGDGKWEYDIIDWKNCYKCFHTYCTFCSPGSKRLRDNGTTWLCCRCLTGTT